MGSYAANKGEVLHETIDGETILIHMGTGSYYSIDGAGSDIFTLAIAGAPEDAIAAQIAERYRSDHALVAGHVSTLIAELIDEELLVTAPDGLAPAVELPEPARAEFTVPELHKYTDMQEFMLVDPLHDVDQAAGWPHAAAG